MAGWNLISLFWLCDCWVDAVGRMKMELTFFMKDTMLVGNIATGVAGRTAKGHSLATITVKWRPNDERLPWRNNDGALTRVTTVFSVTNWVTTCQRSQPERSHSQQRLDCHHFFKQPGWGSPYRVNLSNRPCFTRATALHSCKMHKQHVLHFWSFNIVSVHPSPTSVFKKVSHYIRYYIRLDWHIFRIKAAFLINYVLILFPFFQADYYYYYLLLFIYFIWLLSSF